MDSLKNVTVVVFDGLTNSEKVLLRAMKDRHLRPAKKKEIEYLKNDETLKGGECDLAGLTLISEIEDLSPNVWFVAVERK